jgi:hypothetical protein
MCLLLLIVCVSFFHSPTEDHCDAVKRILRCVQHTRRHGLCIRPSSSCVLLAFSDVDWAGDVEGKRSTAGDMPSFMVPT